MLSFHVDMPKHIEAFTATKDRFIEQPYPAWTAVGTTDLFQGGLCEVSITARMK